MNNLNQQSNGQGFGQWIRSVPLGTKFLLATPILFLLLQILGISLGQYLIDYPVLVLTKFQLQRLFLTQFFEQGIFSFIINPYMFYRYSVDIEQKLGTAVFVVDFFIKGFLVQVMKQNIQVVFLILSLIFQVMDQPSFGMWNLILVYITLQCYANPNGETRLFLVPCTIKAMYLPFLLVGLGFLSSQRFNFLDMFAALILAIVEAKFFNFMIFRPTQGFVQKLENSFLFKFVKGRYDFVLNQTNFYSGAGQSTGLPVQQPVEWQGKGVTIGSGVQQNNYSDSDLQQ